MLNQQEIWMGTGHLWVHVSVHRTYALRWTIVNTAQANMNARESRRKQDSREPECAGLRHGFQATSNWNLEIACLRASPINGR